MGVPAQLTSRRIRRGAAIPTALFGLVTVSVLATAIFASSRTQSMATRNRESSTRAIQLADNGMTHALLLIGDSLKGYPFDRLLKGSDNDGTSSTALADNGRLTGYILSAAADIPAAGRAATGGSYQVQVLDDPADGNTDPFNDLNLKVIVRCTATTDDGGSASVDAIVSQVVLPAIAAEGNLSLVNNAKILGECGSVHANGNITMPTTGSSFPVVAGKLSATGTATGSAKDTLAANKTAQTGKPAIEIPDMNPGDYCPAGADFILRADGFITKVATNETRNAGSNASGGAVHWGWRRQTAPNWTLTQTGAEPGKVCADGNVAVSGNMGTATSSFAITIIATGSVSVTGTPFLKPATSDSILIVAGGDVNLAGNASGTANNYEGLVYAENQCVVAGTPIVSAQILCKNKTATFVSAPMTAISSPFTPFTVFEYGTGNSIGGTATIKYQCGGIFAKRRVFSWVQRVL